ncbi:hypothetical protein HQ584_04490 [Patescibacteria group bacterium]|nr:hypothetical protein [Patescibacteria group bacterium]
MSEKKKWFWFIFFITLIIFTIYAITSGKGQEAFKRVFLPKLYWEEKITEIEGLIETKEKMLTWNEYELQKKYLVMPIEIAQDEFLGIDRNASAKEYQREFDVVTEGIAFIEKSIEKSNEELRQVKQQLKKLE